MNDYELYLVKRAHYKKQLMRKLAAQATFQIDPTEVYNAALEDTVDAVKYDDSNKKRLREEWAKDWAKQRGLTGGGIGLSVGAGLGTAIGAGIAENSRYKPSYVYKKYLYPTLGAAAVGAIGGGIGYGVGRSSGHSAGRAAGEKEGTRLDNEDYKKRVEKAKQDFHMKHTGKLHPNRVDIMKAGNEIYDVY